MKVLSNIFSVIGAQIISMSFFDILDIAIVSVIFYYTYRFVRDRRAGKLAVGILLIILAMFISNILEMKVLSFLIENVVQVGVIGVVILFQSELRTFLEKMGGTSIISGRNKKDKRRLSHTVRCIDAVVEAVSDFSAEKTGALIIFERTTKLGDVIKTGTVIDAEASPFLLKNIFFNKSPLHDGALVIRGNRFYSAGCVLPLSMNPEIVKDLGTRHRAGIGMSEDSDCVSVIVSEETGIVSIAVDGKLTRDYDSVTLKRELVTLLFSQNKNDENNNDGGAEK
ncbi:MAG: diadenylate cyclase CdaA [Clostridia bacterium]|nr:diadenylate cyclase CdaA [Clostridia bacterium]